MICLLQLQGDKFYVSWGVKNIFLIPSHDWIHNYIQELTREWYPALNMSTLQPNRRQGIISMLSGGTAVQFCEPIRGKSMKVDTFEWRLKELLPCFLLYSYFWFSRLSPLPGFDGLTVFHQRRTKNIGYAWISLALVI